MLGEIHAGFRYYSQRSTGRDSDALIRSDPKEQLRTVQAQFGGFLQGRTEGIGKATHISEAMADHNELLYLGQEVIGGIPCHILKAQTDHGTFTVWLAPEKGYNALKFVWQKSRQDILRGNIRLQDEGVTEWTQTVDHIDLDMIRGVFAPVSGRLTSITKYDDGEKDEEHMTARRDEIVLHPDFKALNAFQIGLPEGTEVRLSQDEPVGQFRETARRFRWSNGKFIPDINKYLMRSLLGKPLPSFERLGLEWNPANAPGEMLLVCFFDLNQRSSRNCMQQVARKTRLFTEQGAVLCGIQAARVEKDELRQWLQKTGITVPVGSVRVDEEETRCSWGVRALPWLILTDRKHIVRAEGFSLDELESRIELVGEE